MSIFLIFYVPKIDVFCVTMSGDYAFIHRPTFKAIYLSWVNNDLLDIDSLIGIIESFPVFHCSSGSFNCFLFELIALSRDVYSSKDH